MIRKLNPHEVNIIAAGEVVTSYTSVMKELLENSVDAGAKNIHITYGKDFIQIMDDGLSMNKPDLELCCIKHTTSKFTHIDNINTLGFRGEALYAISSMSHMEIVVCQDGSSGLLWNNQDNKIQHIAANKGTKITVSKLFHDIPARRKFLPHNENHSINTLIRTYIMAYEDLTIQYKYNNVSKFFDHEVVQAMIYKYNPMNINKFAFQIPSIKACGTYEFKGEISLSNSNNIHLFINKRPIKDFKLVNIFKQAHEIKTGKNTINLLCHITCEPHLIDVNVHPTKLEVRFLDQNLYGQILDALLEHITSNNHIISHNYSHFNTDDKHIISHNALTFPTVVKSPLSDHDHDHKLCGSHEVFYDHQDIKYEPMAQNMHEQLHLNDSRTTVIFLYNLYFRYLVFIDNNDLIIMDQHAAHERIVAENIKNHNNHKQSLVIPIIINLAHIKNADILEGLKDFMDYEILNNNLIIHAIPSVLTTEQTKTFIMNAKYNTVAHSILFDFIHEYGCKNSIKSGHALNTAEALDLYKELLTTNNFNTCNHGRPTIIKFNIHQLNKLFGRI